MVLLHPIRLISGNSYILDQVKFLPHFPQIAIDNAFFQSSRTPASPRPRPAHPLAVYKRGIFSDWLVFISDKPQSAKVLRKFIISCGTSVSSAACGETEESSSRSMRRRSVSNDSREASSFLLFADGGSLRTRLANRIFIFTEENGLNKKGAFLPLRNSLQNFPCPSMVLLLQIGPKCELGPCHTFFTSPDICSRIRSNPSAFSLSSVR